ncbi:LOW QUALITY PROTEIN: hypothetical protein V2J09_016455 [Rumex salicifolius]
MILSSSTDKTVRLWQVGSKKCLSVFHHPDFVTSVEFNPVDNGYFSVDGKVRVWGVSEGRVTEWNDTREAVTAVSYQPEGRGLVVGLLNGTCRFYKASSSSGGGGIELSAQVQLPGGKRSSGCRISGIQFCHDNTERAIVTSQDSKVWVFHKTKLIKKYRGIININYCKSSSSSSMLICVCWYVGRFSKVRRSDFRFIDEEWEAHCVGWGGLLWDYNSSNISSSSSSMLSKQQHSPKSRHSCEYLRSQGVSVALQWGGSPHDDGLSTTNPGCCTSQSQFQRTDCTSLLKWFSVEGFSCVITTTWPEEMLSPQTPRPCGGRRVQHGAS